MRVRSRGLAVLVVVGVCGVPFGGAAHASASAPSEEHESGRLIVGFEPSAVGTVVADEAHEEAGGDPVDRVLNVGGKDGVSVEVAEVDDVAGAIDAYLDQPGVRYVEVDRTARAFSNDPLSSQQWNLKAVSGANRGTANVEPAWATSRGDGVVVAVVDTGVKTGGSDLDAGRVLPGRDFVNEDGDPTDDHGHGTHVAGTVAQSTDNGIGAAGVAPGATILPVKVLDATGAGFYSDIIEGIVWAKNRGADVVNLSLGAYDYSQALCDAVAGAHNAGVVVVAASGNESLGTVAYPGACDGALAVGAVRHDGSRPSYSNWGGALDLVAPGGDMAVDQNGDGYPDGIVQQNFTTSWAYRFYEGTSMAAPHVSGAAALVLAADPDVWVEGVLMASTRDLGETGWDDRSGYGALDAAEAVKLAGQFAEDSGKGYWLASESGQVRAFGDAPALGSVATRGSRAKLAAIEETPSGRGYWLLDVDGGVHAFGDAPYAGSLAELKSRGKAPAGVQALDISTTPSGRGYWVLDGAGGIFTFGDARFYGSVPGLRNQGVAIGPAGVVDLASTPTGRGYWLLDDAGGMFAFGDARFMGSVPGLRDSGVAVGPAEIVSLAPTAQGGGYWLVDDAGGMFAFGDASFHGSIPGLRNQGVNVGGSTVVAMEPTGDGGGYWLVDDAGGIFTFGDAHYHGSFPASGVKATAVGIAPSGA